MHTPIDVIQLDVQFGIAIEFGLAPWLTIDDDGDVYLAGTTTSPNFVTTPGVFEGSLQGSNSAFILRLAAEDYSLVAATLLGQDFLFGRPGAYTIADYRLRCNGFRTAVTFGTPFAAAPAFECWPIMAFQRSQRAL